MSFTPEQSAALDQLLAVTASATSASRERDERILRENGWDVQRTVEQIFSMSEATPSAGPSRQQPIEQFQVDDSLLPRPPPGGRRLSGSARGRSNRPNSHVGVVGLGLPGVIAWPVSFIWSIISGAWYFIIRTFIPLSFLPHLPHFLRPPSSTPTRTGPRDPTTQSLHFIRDLETFTGCSTSSGTMLDFYIGSYREFLINVRKEGKMGCVILVCGEHEDDEEFKRDVLCDPELIRCFKEKEIMVWIADVRGREGYQVSQTLLITTYPSLTFLSLVAGASNSVTSPKLSILTTISGPPSTTTSTSSLLQNITTGVLPRATPFLNRLRRERLTVAESRHLREEQDRAFKDAERKDREKLELRKREELNERMKVERAEREEREKQSRIENRRVWRRYARKHLLPPSSGPIRVALRTPFSAERNIRQFTPSSSTTALFIYAETLLIPATDTPETDPDTGPPGYEPEYDFRIVTAYPRKEVARVDSGGESQWEVVKNAGGAVFAEKLENGVWGDAEVKERDGESDEEVEEG